MVTSEEIKKYVEKNRKEIIDWLKSIVSFPSENRPPVGYEGELQKYIIEELKSLGVEVYSFRPDEVDGIKKNRYWLYGRDYSDDRKNVVGVWRGKGNGKSILLSGHIDVAPKEPCGWDVCKPYSPVEVDGRLYGRGTADMKGGLTSMFWAIKILKEIGYEPDGDVIFESLVDEEYAGGNGTLSARLKGFNADFAILSEPSRMQICTASMGAFLGKIEIGGKAGMPYMGEGIPNPVNAAGKVINIFEKWEKKWRKLNKHKLFGEKGKELNVILWNIVSGSRDEFVQMGIPISVDISWIVFCYPGITEDKFYLLFNNFMKEEIEKDEYLKSFRIQIKRDYHFIRPWETDINYKGIKVLKDSFEVYTGKNCEISGAPFSCDMALYGDPGGMPVVILGPRGENLHAPDEWVLIEDVLNLTGIFALFIVMWTGV